MSLGGPARQDNIVFINRNMSIKHIVCIVFTTTESDVFHAMVLAALSLSLQAIVTLGTAYIAIAERGDHLIH